MFTKKSTMLCFYYMMAVDGDISEQEKESLNMIGQELDPEKFFEYKNSLNDLYKEQISNVIDADDVYDLIAEGVDKALTDEADDNESGISLRLLIWNMLTVAFSDNDYSDNERRLLKHIVRTHDIEKDVFLEMEQLMKTNIAVSKEIEAMERSEKPYSEIRPIIDELEERRQVIINSAKALIEDEMYTPVTKVEIQKSNVFESAKNTAGKVSENVVNTVAPIASNLGNQTKKLFGSFMTKVKGKEDQD